MARRHGKKNAVRVQGPVLSAYRIGLLGALGIPDLHLKDLSFGEHKLPFSLSKKTGFFFFDETSVLKKGRAR